MTKTRNTDQTVTTWPYLHISLRRSSTTGFMGYTVDVSTRPRETDAATRKRAIIAVNAVEAELAKLGQERGRHGNID